ncbi:RAD51-associated protein 2 [Talpa occidentalis]|uniref:RAD51-associated protein 2 n=1 Tax=Talpa occidentalis TaxID=50954 RepID=UPI0018901A66|nr:RAD51-associated protein 2 [Talpa occidentalis]
MSLPPLTPRGSELTELAPPSSPLEDPDPQPPGRKRLRLEEPEGVSEAWWRLPLVPRLPEVENAWAWAPRPLSALLYSPHAASEDAARARVETAGPGRRAPGGPAGDGAGAGTRLPRGDGTRGSGPGRGAERGRSDGPRAGGPFAGVTFCQEQKPAFQDVNGCTAAGGMLSNEKENSISASALKIAKSQTPPSVEMAKSGYFRESRTISIREFAANLKSKMSSACWKERAKETGDTQEACVGGFTDTDWARSRRDVEKQNLRDEGMMLGVENVFPELYESYPQSLCNQNVFCGKKKDSVRVNIYNHGSVQSDRRDSGKDFAIISENADLEEAGPCLDSCRSNTSLANSPSWDCTTAYVLSQNRENGWIVDNDKTKCENMRNTGAKLSLLQLLEIGLLNNTIAMRTHEEQLKSLMIGTLGSQKTLIRFLWLKAKGETDNGLQWRYCTTQKDFHLSIFENFIEGILYVHKCISGNQKDSLSWYEILIYKEQNIVRSVDSNRKNNILSIYLQSKFSQPLNILKTSIVSLLSNFDSLTRIENDSQLEEGYIFKWIVSYPQNAVESHDILRRFSTLLEDNMAPTLETGQLKNEQVFEEPMKKSINSFSMTTKNTQFPVFETYEKVSLSMDFDNLDEILSTKEISYRNKCCPEQLMNEGNLTIKTLNKCRPPFMWNNHEYINANLYEISKYNQDLDTERKPEHNILSSFNFKDVLEDFINIRQQAIQSSHHRRHSEQINPTSIIQALNFGNLLTETEGKNRNLILKEEVKVTAQSLTNSCHAHEDIKIEKEENIFDSKDDMFSVQPVFLMNNKVNVEGPKNVYLNNVDESNEYESILQEMELANSEHFHPKNDSTESVNHQSETDLSVRNNECFQDSTAKCLPTETLTIVKDFEMKSKFDLVLEELRMFHEISKENEILSTVETNNGLENYFGENNVGKVKMEIKKDLKVGAGNKICTSSLYCDTKAGPVMHKRHQNAFKWKTVSKSGEQEVPEEYYCSRTSEEELLYSEKDCEKPSPKRPASFSDEFNEEKFNYLLKGGSNFSNGISRVLPLKTCSRPIRIGLSRKAKLKQLHPYLK